MAAKQNLKVVSSYFVRIYIRGCKAYIRETHAHKQ